MMVPSLNSLLYPTEIERALAVTKLREQIGALNDAMNAGITTASYDGKSVSYASFADMQKAISRAERQLVALATGLRRPTAGFSVFNRGNR